MAERDDIAEQRLKLERDLKDIDKRISRLVEAIETGGDATALVSKVRELEARKSALQKDALALHPIPRLAPAVIENRLAEWRRLLRASTTQARAVLQRVLNGRIVFTPRTDSEGYFTGYDFEAPTRFEKLFTGIVCERPKGLVPGDRTGCEGITPEDTFDAEYGRLLDRASEGVKGVASPTGFEPVFWP